MRGRREAWSCTCGTTGRPGSPDEPGTPGWQLRLDPAAGEPVIRKRDDDGFEGTELDALLAGRQVRRLVIAGLLSEMCVSATARAALRRGYQVVLPHDAHATYGIPEAAELGASPVPAPAVARVAEWALGDEVELVARAAGVRFAAPRG